MCFKYPNLGDKASVTICRGCNQSYNPVCLDVDHIDSNKENDTYKNLQVLCANCHRLKTMLCGDTTTNKEDK